MAHLDVTLASPRETLATSAGVVCRPLSASTGRCQSCPANWQSPNPPLVQASGISRSVWKGQQTLCLISTSVIACSLWMRGDVMWYGGLQVKYHNNRLNQNFDSTYWTGRQFAMLTQKQRSHQRAGGRYSIRSITSQGKILPGVRYEMWNFSGSCVSFGEVQWRVCFGSQAPNGKITSSLNLKWFLPIHNNLHLQGISKLSPTTSLSHEGGFGTLEHGKTDLWNDIH